MKNEFCVPIDNYLFKKLSPYLCLFFVLLGGHTPVWASEDSLNNPCCQPCGNVLVSGASIHGANGIYFDQHDQLYIASVVGREIVVINRNTGKILKRMGTVLGVETPDDVTFGPDGSLYWTAIMTGEVGRISPDGDKTGQFVAPGVNPITFSDDGRLFVALDFLGDALYELDPDLVEAPRLIAENLGYLNGMDWGPDGYLYGPIFTQQRVVRIDVDTDPPLIETVAQGFGIPAAVKFDSQGRLHAIDTLTGDVTRIDTDTGSIEVIARIAPGLDNLAFDSRDRLFVSCLNTGGIFEVFNNGWPRPVIKGGIVAGQGVAVMPRPDGGESVYVADQWTLHEFDGSTGNQRSARGYNWMHGDMTSPATVSRYGEYLLLTSWFGNSVQVYDPETQQVVADYPDFFVPLNAIEFQGDFVVAELGSEAYSVPPRVVRGSDRSSIGSGLVLPVGLAARDDDLWVSDWATGMVWQIVVNGVIQDTPELVAEGLSYPEGLAVSLDGKSLLVVETGTKCLSRISLSSGHKRIVKEGLAVALEIVPGSPPTWGFTGVTVGTSGTIYCTGPSASALYRIPQGSGFDFDFKN